MLIRHHSLEVFTPPCSPESTTYTARLTFPTDITPVLPYLNARLAGAAYHPEAPALVWTSAQRVVVFHPHEIAVSDITDRTDAEIAARELVNLVNDTWSERERIEPDHTGVRRAAPMALFKLLPRTNCRECGEPTCFSFALKLAAGERSPAECPPLREPGFDDARTGLESLLPPRQSF